MDDKGATFLADLLVPRAEAGPAPGAGPAEPTYLIILSGGIPGAMLRVGPGVNRIGRSLDNTLQVPEGTISRRHATLRVDPDGLAWLCDLGSTNGTFHNSRRLEPNCPVPLRDGDRVRFGQSTLVKFVRPDPCEERFQREMYERAVRDALTGLYNRSYFLDGLAALAQHARQRGLGLALLMLDLDHFKRINDTHGHPAGDQVLREMAAVLRQSTRAEDLVARYGGEEFIAAFPIANADHARERAELIRRALASRRVIVGEQALRVTVSIGLAYAPPVRVSAPLPLIAAADRLLYQAKHQGRDRVVCGPLPAAPPPSTQVTADGEGGYEPEDLLPDLGLSELLGSSSGEHVALRG